MPLVGSLEPLARGGTRRCPSARGAHARTALSARACAGCSSSPLLLADLPVHLRRAAAACCGYLALCGRWCRGRCCGRSARRGAAWPRLAARAASSCSTGAARALCTRAAPGGKFRAFATPPTAPIHPRAAAAWTRAAFCCGCASRVRGAEDGGGECFLVFLFLIRAALVVHPHPCARPPAHPSPAAPRLRRGGVRGGPRPAGRRL
jgi:hypothetical protein